MKAEDLMIGDWINRFGKPYKVIGIDISETPEIYIYQSDKDDDDDTNIVSCLVENIDPIPLTPEILEKIGFSSMSNIGYIIDDYSGTQIIYDLWDKNLRIIKDYKVMLDIKSFYPLNVHEFQHAMKIVDINKEIDL